MCKESHEWLVYNLQGQVYGTGSYHKSGEMVTVNAAAKSNLLFTTASTSEMQAALHCLSSD